LPTSVTLTALSNLPEPSSRTATLLTPSSLIIFIASSALAVEDTDTTAVYRYSDGSCRALKGLVRYRVREAVDRAVEVM
jgi:hypothetical protein